MAKHLQKQFAQFHENIKLTNTKDNVPLRDKREILVQALKDYFDNKAETEGKTKITFTAENQGSYSMGTGIKPLEGEDYDIDVMILFNFSKDDYSPVKVKEWVFEALNSVGNREVIYKKPCVRVQYKKAGEEHFHVDMALYANSNDNGKTYLSVGKPTSATADKKWEVSNPKALKEKINSKYKNADEKQQMKRVIRYLKRWKDLKFPKTGDARPTGIAFTALAYNHFVPEIDVTSKFASTVEGNDLVAFRQLTERILEQYSWWTERFSVKLPVEPGNDLFERMKPGQHKTLKEKLEKLKEVLVSAENEIDPHEA
ncbi:MAG: nucleotidyltransferase, partial [Bacteroidetes bacterium]|nr:nucleotidyltransferase [Bacteroidota bacterium]